ncbi:max-binding protein MNT isoform X2 [Nelusetta ayraudi]|uniref:max-binding protein MNT isoform X2 n=1 Tax=Nelusetta ayraudi TaxID=303726 RepID=UPI003F6ECE82
MSIETLLEAAKFLELQAQQQKARGKLQRQEQRQEQLTERRTSDVKYTPTEPISNVPKTEERCSEGRPAPLSPPPLPLSMPITVIPIPVLTASLTGSPGLSGGALSPPAAPPPAATLPCSPQPGPEQPSSAFAATGQKQPMPNQPSAQPPPLVAQTNGSKPQHAAQRYSGSIVSSSPPRPQSILPQQAPQQNSPVRRGSPPADSLHFDSKKRPGGAGTREVHNKLEKNRRAHLKECFETLKKNIPNVEEKKTSNLSVLRSALRYIQTLKRKEKEYEHDMERLAREKIATQQRLAELKNDVSQWMDVMEVERLLRQTVQPEEDQASTSTASGEEDMEDEQDDGPAGVQLTVSPAVPHPAKPEPEKVATPAPTPAPPPPTTAAAPSFITQHISIQQHKPPHAHGLPQLHPLQLAAKTPAAFLPAHTQVVTVPSLHPTVIAHAPVSHPSVIQAVNHVIQGAGAPPPKHGQAHLAPSPSPTTAAAAGGSVQLGPAHHQPIGHITVHPVAHLGQHLPALYSQPVAHIAHTLNHLHPHISGAATAGQPAAALLGKQAAAAVGAQMVAHHPQLVGQTVFNPVTMVTMPSFPISTLKLT